MSNIEPRDGIPPALSAEEWARAVQWPSDREARVWPDAAGELWDGPAPMFWGDDSAENVKLTDRPHAMAALCLYGTPEGFTHDDLATILDVALYEQNNGTYPDSSPFSDETLASLKSLHARLAALLPPPPESQP